MYQGAASPTMSLCNEQQDQSTLRDADPSDKNHHAPTDSPGEPASAQSSHLTYLTRSGRDLRLSSEKPLLISWFSLLLWEL